MRLWLVPAAVLIAVAVAYVAIPYFSMRALVSELVIPAADMTIRINDFKCRFSYSYEGRYAVEFGGSPAKEAFDDAIEKAAVVPVDTTVKLVLTGDEWPARCG